MNAAVFAYTLPAATASRSTRINACLPAAAGGAQGGQHIGREAHIDFLISKLDVRITKNPHERIFMRVSRNALDFYSRVSFTHQFFINKNNVL